MTPKLSKFIKLAAISTIGVAALVGVGTFLKSKAPWTHEQANQIVNIKMQENGSYVSVKFYFHRGPKDYLYQVYSQKPGEKPKLCDNGIYNHSFKQSFGGYVTDWSLMGKECDIMAMTNGKITPEQIQGELTNLREKRANYIKNYPTSTAEQLKRVI